MRGGAQLGELLRGVFARVKRARTAQRDAGIVVAGTVTGQAVVALSSPLLTRLYGPGTLGMYFVYYALAVLVANVAALRYEFAVPVAADEDVTDAIALSLVVAVGSVTVLGIGVLLYGPERAALSVGLPDVAMLAATGGAIVLESARVTGRLAVIRRQKFRASAGNAAMQAIVRAGAQLTLGLYTPTLLALVGADLVVRFGSAAHLLVVGGARRPTSKSALARLAQDYRRFATLSAPATLLNGFSMQGPVLVLSRAFGPEVAGWFGLVQRVAGVPAAILGRALMEVYYGRLAHAVRAGSAQVMRLFRDTTLLAAVFAAPVLGLGFFGLGEFAWLVFGEQWRPVGTYLQVLTPMLVLHFVSTTVDPTLAVLERQDLHLSREALRFGLTAAALGSGVLIGDDRATVVLISAAGTVGYAYYVVSSWRALRQVRTGGGSNSADLHP